MSSTNNKNTLNVAVSGAGGQLGGAIVAELAAKKLANLKIVAISRSAATTPIAGAHESRAGDANDRASLERAYAGVERVVIIISSDLTPGLRAKQVNTAIDAAVAAGVKHVVVFGLAGSHDEPLGRVGYEYFQIEQHLLKTVPANGWTIIRMALFAESVAGLVLGQDNNVVGFSETARFNIVSRDDLAAAAAAVLASSDIAAHRGATYNGTGPHAFTLAEVADVARKVHNKPSAVHVTTPAQHRATLTSFQLPPPVVDLLVQLHEAFAAGDLDITTGDIRRLTGRAPRTLEQVLAAAAAAKK